MSEGREYGVYVVLFTFRCEDQENKATELEPRVLTKVECVEGGDEWDYEPRCGTSKKAVQ